MDKGEKPNENQKSKIKESREEESKRSITTSEREKEKAAEGGAEYLAVVPSYIGDNHVWDEEEQQWVCKMSYSSG